MKAVMGADFACNRAYRPRGVDCHAKAQVNGGKPARLFSPLCALAHSSTMLKSLPLPTMTLKPILRHAL
jgi:hypothetical protein